MDWSVGLGKLDPLKEIMMPTKEGSLSTELGEYKNDDRFEEGKTYLKYRFQSGHYHEMYCPHIEQALKLIRKLCHNSPPFRYFQP